MLDDTDLHTGEFALAQVESPQTVPVLRYEPNARSAKPEVEARAPVRRKDASEWSEWPAHPGDALRQATSNKRRTGLLKRRPVLYAIGAMVLGAAVAGGYIYLDYAEHFESTDDAFIAARQTALAPKVAGYITAVPVSDNDHVAAGDVIARIDDRDYRIALDQAEAQVAAAQASTTRSSKSSRRRSPQTRRRSSRPRRRWCSRNQQF
jgi:membrane fusion protein, multidrug efflux system